MRITKFGHAAVRVEYDGRVLLIDPGVWTGAEAIDGADAVLITHEHPDHVDPALLRRTDAPVWTIEAVARDLEANAPDVAERVLVIEPGEEWSAAGLDITAVGELHAVIHPELPRVTNSGYLITDGTTRLFHPGDALTGPGEEVDVLCLPVSAPWLKVSEAIDFARGVGAGRNLAIHDKVYSEAGLGIVDGHLGRFLGAAGQDYVRLPEGADLD
ncbi:MBL fold metallo-hydrolase [Nocardioides cavernaquae]|uniref:MBL fold metallo-hydrolase n=1 Tax=Nocardioides cavernaquae TaxID=2321396 RepID=A0A3A5HDM8_9ACTN|nr:MBL fold metallo-hydrolase [Nocardioides cavernaquae]RJS46134.1 MBL fold metallo-hydrolase [Nocardioides cavernaquae]